LYPGRFGSVAVTNPPAPPRRLALVAAFAAVYVIWGSTYLAIRFAVADMPPFLMAAARWLVAGSALYAYRRFVARDAAPRAIHWRSALVVGALLVVCGNGVVSWAEQLVPSSITALLIAIVPVWIALYLWASTRARPHWRVAAGILVGLAGVAFLVAPQLRQGDGEVAGLAVLLVATVAWTAGSMYSRRAALPPSALLGASMEMLCGGALLALVGLARGEAPRVHLASVGEPAWIGFAFLVLFGSLVGYSCYVWLLQVARPELVATYAFVNPVVAVVLGTVIAGESLTRLTLVAAGLIVVAVAVVTTAPRRAAMEPAAVPAVADHG
jgi:drug/metabolite transporter (DMT)-like permease